MRREVACDPHTGTWRVHLGFLLKPCPAGRLTPCAPSVPSGALLACSPSGEQAACQWRRTVRASRPHQQWLVEAPCWAAGHPKEQMGTGGKLPWPLCMSGGFLCLHPGVDICEVLKGAEKMFFPLTKPFLTCLPSLFQHPQIRRNLGLHVRFWTSKIKCEGLLEGREKI